MTHTSHVPTAKIAAAGFLAIIFSVVANLIVRTISAAILTVPSTFAPLGWSAPVLLTIGGVIAATVVFWLFMKFISNPVKSYKTVAVVALFLSFIPDIMLFVSPDPEDAGVTFILVVPLLIMHVVAYIISVRLLTQSVHASHVAA